MLLEVHDKIFHARVWKILKSCKN